jgi:hypothetical protein
MKHNPPSQAIDLAGLKISLKTYGKLTFFFNIAKAPTTCVRRRISRISRSSGLLVLIERQCSDGIA